MRFCVPVCSGALFMHAIYLITTGGTIEKSYSERTGKLLNLASKIRPYLAQMRLPHTQIKIVPLLAKDSVELTAEDRGTLCSAVRRRLPRHCPMVITHGTDTMIETALALEKALGEVPVPIIFTGAFAPLGFENSDGMQNLTEALLAAKLLKPGIHLVIHNHVFDIRVVRKDRRARTFVRAARARKHPVAMGQSTRRS
jgi:L-asparaginase